MLGRLGRHAPAVRCQRQALHHFRASGDQSGEARALTNLGIIEEAFGRYLFREIGHRYGEAAAHNGLGESLRAAGRTADARTHHTLALAITAETRDRDEQARARSGLASLAGDHGALSAG
ncbi:MAG TPA: hypothetical protein VFV67_22375 [Actinophytocola sp.]|uniref:hypothetical protein n=1 Tax=Actinophytocola sp. TaxID=1872138 RepID=UPI002DB86E58|nr:hypothetical protein [Actinophytocola sp.]HEU5473399.1 hypothetical protein [Actinophytocola sp.]